MLDVRDRRYKYNGQSWINERRKDVRNADDKLVGLWWNAKHVPVPEGEEWDEKGMTNGEMNGSWGRYKRILINIIYIMMKGMMEEERKVVMKCWDERALKARGPQGVFDWEK